MVTSLKSSAIAILTATLLSSGAYASDIYGKGSTKDGAGADSSPVTHWTGFYVTGALGVAKQDYDVRRGVDRELGAYRVDTKGEDGISGNADDTATPLRYEAPLAVHSFGDSFSFDSDTNIEGGGELSFKVQRGRFIFEPFVSANISGSDDEGVAYTYGLTPANAVTGAPLTSRDSLPSAGNGYSIGYPTAALTPGAIPFDAGGFVSASKDWDANVGLKAGYLVAPNVNVYIGGGLTYGSFSVKGADAIGFDTKNVATFSYNDDEGALGYVLLGGIQAKQGRFVFGVQGEYRDFGSIDINHSKTVDNPYGATGAYVRTGGKDEIDATEWAVKGTISYQLSD